MFQSSFPIRREPLENPQTDAPIKRLYTPEQIHEWLRSKAYHDYMDFVISTNYFVKNLPSSYKIKERGSNLIESLITLLDFVDKLVDDTPLEVKKSIQRFGNPAYRTLFDKIQECKKKLVLEFFETNGRENAPNYEIEELSTYIGESWGNRVRIDYGSGHEAAFGFFLCCIHKIGMMKEGKDETVMLVTRVFRKYIDICRKIQIKYKLEPAGSHGCWGLDDFQFLPFLWGSSQILNHEEIRPKDILSEGMHKRFKDENLYFDAVAYIMRVKKGPFHEHSGILYSLTTCPNWKKINGGMIKMYVAEVLKKYVVVQHFLFGRIMSFDKYEGEDNIKMYL